MATILDPKTLRGLTPEAVLAMNWWAAAVRGVSAIVLGILAISVPALTLIGLVMIFAVYCFVDGIFAIVLAIRGARKHQRWGWLAFNGTVSLVVAALAAFYPFVTVFVLVILFAAWALISGAATLAAAVRLPKRHGRWWLIATGVIAIVFGLAMLFLPTLGMLTLIYLVGFQALLSGIALLVLAFQLRARSVELPGGEGAAEAPVSDSGIPAGG
jgi:uncharacterized membrane protein HdeD (DUF308 family)